MSEIILTDNPDNILEYIEIVNPTKGTLDANNDMLLISDKNPILPNSGQTTYELVIHKVNHITDTGNTVNYPTINAVTEYFFNSQSGITINQSQVTNLINDLAGKSGTGHTHGQYTIGSDFNTHTGDTSIHFVQSAITITQSQVSNLISDLAGKSGTGHTHGIYTLGTDFNSHTGDTSIHYVQSAITITQSQVSGLTTILNNKQNNLAFVANSENKFLRDDNVFQLIEPPSGGYANNLYFSEYDSDISGYKSLTYTPDILPSAHTHTVTESDGDKLLHTYIYPLGVGVTNFPSGLWSFNFYGNVDSVNGVTQLGVTYFARHLDNSETDLFTVWSDEINNSVDTWIKFNTTQPNFILVETDRMGARVLAKTTKVNDVQIIYAVGDGYGAFINNPNKIRHSQLRALNGDNDFLHVTSTEKSYWDSKLDTTTFSGFTGTTLPTIYYNKTEVDNNFLGLSVFMNYSGNTNTILNNKITKVTGSTSNIIVFSTNGDIADSGVNINDIGGGTNSTALKELENNLIAYQIALSI